VTDFFHDRFAGVKSRSFPKHDIANFLFYVLEWCFRFSTKKEKKKKTLGHHGGRTCLHHVRISAMVCVSFPVLCQGRARDHSVD